MQVKRWHALKWKLGISPDPYPVWVGGRKGMADAIPIVAPEKSAEDEESVLAELVAIAEAEIRNAEATIALVMWVIAARLLMGMGQVIAMDDIQGDDRHVHATDHPQQRLHANDQANPFVGLACPESRFHSDLVRQEDNACSRHQDGSRPSRSYQW